MVLEVIVENRPAIALYEKLGFVRIRELEVLSLAGAEPDGARRRGGAARCRPVPRPGTPGGGRAVAARRRHGRSPRRGRAGAAGDRRRRRCGRLPRRPAGVGLVQAAGDERGLAAILLTLRAKGTVSAVNYPAGGAVAAALHAAGAEVSLRQYEMVKRL